jgi:replicative DNA helicase
MRPGELVVIGARPSMGKSALCLAMARNVARAGPVLVCSMEDSDMMLVSRQVAAAGRVNLADIRTPQHAPDSMWRGVAEGVDALQALPLYIDDKPALALRDVRRKAMQVLRRKGALQLVIVDYLQLMQGEGETRHQQLGGIAAGLKALAKELRCAVVLLSQLNREADKTDGPPRIDHLRESGGIEEAADIVGLLWREHRRKPRPDNKHLAQIEFAKHKNGPTDTIKLWFDGATQRFGDWAPEADRAH